MKAAVFALGGGARHLRGTCGRRSSGTAEGPEDVGHARGSVVSSAPGRVYDPASSSIWDVRLVVLRRPRPAPPVRGAHAGRRGLVRAGSLRAARPGGEERCHRQWQRAASSPAMLSGRLRTGGGGPFGHVPDRRRRCTRLRRPLARPLGPGPGAHDGRGDRVPAVGKAGALRRMGPLLDLPSAARAWRTTPPGRLSSAAECASGSEDHRPHPTTRIGGGARRVRRAPPRRTRTDTRGRGAGCAARLGAFGRPRHGARVARDGRHRRAAGHRGRRRRAAGRRQRGGRGGRDRVRARRRLPGGGQHRRRRLHGRATRGRAQTLRSTSARRAPLAATRDMYLDERRRAHRPLDHRPPRRPACPAPSPACGPRTSATARRPWRDLLAPAIRLAEKGSSSTSTSPRPYANDSARLSRFPASAALFLPGGEPLRAGDVWRNPDLAAVLRRIAERGPAGFYEGETARPHRGRDAARRRHHHARGPAQLRAAVARARRVRVPRPPGRSRCRRRPRAGSRSRSSRTSSRATTSAVSAGSTPRRCTSSPRRCAARSRTGTTTSATRTS